MLVNNILQLTHFITIIFRIYGLEEDFDFPTARISFNQQKQTCKKTHETQEDKPC